MLRNSSVKTIDSPEFINVSPRSDMISECQIKVLYLGENRNGSSISKEVAARMADTLPGMPIVAAYLPEKDDFSDHGHVITIEDGEVKFSCKTVPYGFVAPDTQVWFQKFIDTDQDGNEVEREYMMATGYLWTGQFPELNKVIEEGMPQSMELDEGSISGYWTNNDEGLDFFIINDAAFSKLCILGSDVEPCFEGASVTSVTEYQAIPEFAKKLYEMRQELQFSLQIEGGSVMLKNEETVEELPATEFEAVDGGDDAAEGAEGETGSAETDETPAEDGESEESEDEGEQEETPEDDPIVEEPEEGEPSIEPEPEPESYVDNNGDGAPMKKIFSKEEDEEKKEDAEESEEEEDEKKPSKDHSLEEVEAKFAAIKAELETVQSQLASANLELESLRSFKLGIEEKQKDALIAKYHMLEQSDIKDIIENKASYSYEELEGKLALAYVKKNVDFETLTGEKEEECEVHSPITSFSLDTAADMTFITDSLGERLMEFRRRNN